MKAEAKFSKCCAWPAEDYRREIMPAARQVHQIHNGGGLTAAGMIGYSNICRSRCLYCGMRAGSVIRATGCRRTT